MKKLNKFKIWFGKKLIEWGFTILLELDDRDWNPKKEAYPGSVKQTKYALGSWLVKHGIRLETKGLNKEGWPGYLNTVYDPTFYKYLQRPIKKRKKRDNDGPDFGNIFKDWQ